MSSMFKKKCYDATVKLPRKQLGSLFLFSKLAPVAYLWSNQEIWGMTLEILEILQPTRHHYIKNISNFLVSWQTQGVWYID